MATDVIQNNTPSTNQQNGVITSDQLKPSPTLNLPDAPKYTYGGIPGATEALVTQAKTDQQNQLDLQKQGVDNSLKQYMDELVNSGNISSSVDRTAQNTAKEKYNYYTSLLEQENLANRRAIEAIQSRGGLASQVDAEVADVNRKSLSKQADIAILQTAANRDYETASAIADRQVALNLEKSNAKLSALKYFYEQNKSDFTTQETRAYEQKIKEEERAYNKEAELQKTISEIKTNVAQSDAPNKLELLTKLGQVKSLDEALGVAGQYSGDYLKVQLLKEQIKTEKAQQSNYYANIAKTKSETGGGTSTDTSKLTDAQVQNAGYADRIQQANTIIDNNSNTFKNMNYIQFKLAQSNSPLANKALTPAQQEVAQAMRNFITAKLRKESGASISPTEFEDARSTYFPVLGDSDSVLENKKALRDSVLNNLAIGSGGAFTVNNQTQTNKFGTALGQTNEVIPGTSIVSNVSNDGSINFNIPTK